MTKQRLFLGVLGLLLALAIPLVAGPTAAEWDQMKKDFYRDFSNQDVSVKKSALDRIAAVNTLDAAKLLLSVYGAVKQETDAMDDKCQANVDDLEKKLKPLRAAKSALSAGEADRKAKIEAELKAVNDDKTKKDGDAKKVLDTIASAIGKFTDAGAVSELKKMVLSAPDWTDRYAILSGLLASGADGVGSICLEAAKDKDVRVRIIALDGLLNLKIDAAIPLFIAAVEDAQWQVRLSGVAGVEQYHAKDGVPAMIRQLKKEDGRLRDDISGALKRMTGMDFGYNADNWSEWWKVNGDKWNGKPIGGGAVAGGNDVKSPGGAGGTTTEPPTFFGLKITSKKIVFVLDVSGSMAEPSEPPPDKGKEPPPTLSGGNGPKPEPWEPGMTGTKLEVLKHEFEKTITKLDPKTTFNIIVFASDVQQWKEKMQTATPPIKAEAIDFVKKQAPTSQTNSGDALEKAFELAGMGLSDKSYAALVDTIYLMSDGSPNAGKYPNPDDITRKIEEWNKLSKVIINCVGLGNPTNYNPSFLQRVASMTGGVFVKR
ncbi:MAG: VWA domain-containing protein [Planctomycetes bacterium]|nr:VWA domain-containing protein [Planctomycetota bacterium]